MNFNHRIALNEPSAIREMDYPAEYPDEYAGEFQEAYQGEFQQNAHLKQKQQEYENDDYNSNSNGEVKNEFGRELDDGDSNENPNPTPNLNARNFLFQQNNNGTEADLFTNSIKAELEQQRQLGAFDQYNENTNTNDADEDGEHSRYSKGSELREELRDELRDLEQVQIKDERRERREHSRSRSKEASRDRERRRSRSKERRRKERERSSRDRERSSDRSSKDKRRKDDKYKEKKRSRSRSAGRRRRDDSRDRVKSRNRSRERRDRSPRKLAKRRRPSKYWDVAPVGFEHVTPLQYKAMQAAGQIPATLFVPSSAPQVQAPAVTGASSSAPIGSTITRQARRLYIGNIPFGCTEEEMMEFFNSQMRSCNFVQATGNSVLAVQINLDKNFAFLEVNIEQFRTVSSRATITNGD